MNDFESDPAPGPLNSGDLQELRELVAAIRQHDGRWGSLEGGARVGPREFTMPFVEMEPLAEKALMWLYDSNRVFWFDWPEWDKGRRIFQEWNDDTPDSLDHLTVRKLLTAIARNDRFSDGAWVGLFEDGRAQHLFARLLELEEELATNSEP